MNKYGALPKDLGIHLVDCEEMLFYQYLPIKLIKDSGLFYESRLNFFKTLIDKCSTDFVKEFGNDKYLNSYIYLTAKKMHQTEGCSFNRKGYHSDGFLTDDINYVWSDKNPTIFNDSDFNLTLDDKVSIKEMGLQANEKNIKIYPENSLLRLDQFNIHRVSENDDSSLRTFVKISFSTNKYDLLGNSKNYLIDYDWKMRSRELYRNIPQKL